MSNNILIRLDRLEEIEGFIEALDEWGCEEDEARQMEIAAFLQSPIGLIQYLERDVPEIIGHA